MFVDADLGMHAYNHYGRDLTGSFGVGNVRFQRDVNIAEQLQRTFSDRFVGTFAQVSGPDDTFAQAEIPDAADRIAREIAVTADSVEDTTLEAVGLAALSLRLARGETLSFPIVVGDDETTGRYLPGPPGSNGHVWIGDLVTVDTGSELPDFPDADARVLSETVEEDDAGGLVCKIEVRVGTLADVGSLGADTPESAVIGDTAGECGCPPFDAGGPGFDEHYYSGTIYDSVPQFGGEAATSADHTAVWIHDTIYTWAVIVTEATIVSPGVAGFSIIDQTSGHVYFNEVITGNPLLDTGTFDTGGGFGTSGDLLARLNVVHNDTSVQDITIEFWVDPPGWVAPVAAVPEYGQEVIHDTVVETADGSTTDFTLVLGAIVGYKAGSLQVEENGVDVSPYITETDTAAGTFAFLNAPPTGTEIVVRRYQSALVA
jgi:hypothetical protein